MAHLLNKGDMASSIGISVQAFDKWGVPPVERRGREVFYDVKAVLKIDRERQLQSHKSTDDSDDLETKLLQARIELTEEQAIAQRFKNQIADHRVINTEFCIFALSRLAGELASVLDSIPLSMQRRFPDFNDRQLMYLKELVAKGANKCVESAEKMPEFADEYYRSADE